MKMLRIGIASYEEEGAGPWRSPGGSSSRRRPIQRSGFPRLKVWFESFPTRTDHC